MKKGQWDRSRWEILHTRFLFLQKATWVFVFPLMFTFWICCGPLLKEGLRTCQKFLFALPFPPCTLMRPELPWPPPLKMLLRAPGPIGLALASGAAMAPEIAMMSAVSASLRAWTTAPARELFPQ
ncbi:hypothetical protein ACRYCC_10045 [Actinomadura scrupuli]|uniref:hypothetical protein n=1 Tax=Actinomadura scrupuli TaxID=559629 RepID=UPI003D99AD85